MRVPPYVEFISAENAAAGMSRGLVERTDTWGRLIASAQKVLAEAQNELARTQQTFSPSEYYNVVESAPLIAASRILDAASRAPNIDAPHRQRLALCAAAAFSMYGNFPSAHAVLQATVLSSESLSSLVWLAIGCFSPRNLADARLHAISGKDALASTAIENLQSFLVLGDDEYITKVDRLILKAFGTCADNLENLLLGYARVSLRHIHLLSVKKALSGFDALPASVVGKVVEAGIATLLPSQFEVLCKSPFLTANGNSLVCLPTSTGKTLIGELAIAAALGGRPGLAIFIAPYVAIGMQAARALGEHLPAPYRVHTLVGGLSSEAKINPSVHAEVLVTTPERLDAILRRLNAFDHLRIVVVDEAHVVSDGARGVRLEALLSRLRLQQALGRQFRILCLSAVMADSKRFRDWLGVTDDLFITCLWRPTARRVAIWATSNKLIWLYAGDDLRPPAAKSNTIFGTKSLVWPMRMQQASDFPAMTAQSPALYANIAYLCRQMHEEYREPVLCVCASRASSRGIAYRLSEDFDPIEVLSEELCEAITFIDTQATHLAGLRNCLKHGVAFHNAALPVRLRLLIEKAVEKRSLKVVCATTTLAEGVDLPFRVTVLAEWLQWRMDTKDQRKPFAALKFRNIAGRSGRAGVFTEGDTIVFENVLGPSKFIDQQNRGASILSMLDQPKEVASALEEDVLPGEIEARKRVLASNFLAAIPENPNDNALETSLAQSLLVRTLPGGETAQQLTARIRADVLSGDDMAFARAASPLHLTPIGQAAQQSLFSPETCRKIIDTMRTMPSAREFEAVATYLLCELGTVPEQHNPDWSKRTSGAGSKFVVKTSDLSSVLALWRAGVDLPEMFVQLPSVKKSKAKDSVSEWLAGRKTSENWSNSFDKFADFVGAVIEEFLPWVLNACIAFAPFIPKDEEEQPWEAFRSLIEETVTTRRSRPLATEQEQSP